MEGVEIQLLSVCSVPFSVALLRRMKRRRLGDAETETGDVVLRDRRQQGWLGKAAAGCPQSKALRAVGDVVCLSKGESWKVGNSQNSALESRATVGEQGTTPTFGPWRRWAIPSSPWNCFCV